MDISKFFPEQEPVAERGETIAGRYLVEEEIARGGMAHIFRAVDIYLDTKVALKILPPVLAKSKTAIEEIKEEARIAMSLNHPNIVHLHHFEDGPEYKFLVMEYVDGPSLADIVDQKNTVALDEAISYMRGACAGLEYAHSRRIVHRDVKSANFLVDPEGTVKLTDFGIAQKVRRALAKVTQKQVMGTVPYMSPEQLMGYKIDYRSDIYSLGVVLYELLSGFPPFFTGGIEAQIMLKIPEEIAGIPGHINDAILRALNKGPALRWNSASDFYHALINEPPPQEPPEQQIQWPAARVGSGAQNRRDFKILAVDDEEDLRVVIQTILANAGYQVDTAFDGRDGLEKIAKTSYDLLVLDIMMPRMDGIALLSRVRNEGSNIPVLMLTALTDQKHMLESYRSGADYYMSKPFSRNKLIAAVRYLLDDFSENEKEKLERLL